MTDTINRTRCNTTCSHDGICTLDIDHAGFHSASGHCEWERSVNDNIESDEEAMNLAIDSITQIRGMT